MTTPAADRLYHHMTPIAWGDDAVGYPLRAFCEALALPLDPLEDLFHGDESGEHSPWALAVHAQHAPLWVLPWLKQLAGVEWGDPPSEDLRAKILDRPSWRRGTTAAIVEAGRATLTGTKTMIVIERDGSPWNLTISTSPGETPDAAATLRAMLEQKPFGIVLTHLVGDSPPINSGSDTINSGTATINAAVLADII